MILKKVAVENFRLLKKFELKFADSEKRNLTVIRAANETGKTTLLYALQWGIFGDNALPSKGGNYRLSPIDQSGDIRISVTIDFEIVNSRGAKSSYVLQRTAEEKVSGNKFERNKKSEVSLFRRTETGVDEIGQAQGWLKPHLPEDLREVFFTDGDRALSFIEGTDSDQSKKVEGAIRSLLGLEIIENSVSHVQQVKTLLARRVRSDFDESEALKSKVEQITNLSESIPLDELSMKSIEANIKYNDTQYQKVDRLLMNALKAGDKRKLESDLKTVRINKAKAFKRYEENTRSQSDLFRAKDLGLSLLSKDINNSFTLLEKLYKDGVLPNSAVPIMINRLQNTTCFCGACIDANKPDGALRRKNIQDLISESEEESEVNQLATDLFYRAKTLRESSDPERFISNFTKFMNDRTEAESERVEAEVNVRDIEAQIDQIPDMDVAGLQKTRKERLDQGKLLTGQLASVNMKLYQDKGRLGELEEEQGKLLTIDVKGRQILGELTVAEDLLKLFKSSLEQMKSLELEKVSNLMNQIFLRMIGASETESDLAIIQKAEIDNDFKIIVHGNSGNVLNPSQDLNGASRRALTLAFIMALTKVSEVIAPNVIDTPLGMTSGYVKNSILRLSCQNSSQLIMLLTHDEIKGCEELIDEFAGVVTTLTNPAHYPKILINDPQVNDICIIQCDCDHRTVCSVCERRESEGLIS